ncbi:beta-lactamase family protein [Hymenobacter sp. BT664]|uniref:Beta-lactamase family protein n=1 Tax=Hymenobacter montanus TaxID=2771359 RepID=A0A927GK49_9BACT|nr:serine hydrolase domain-containing protein [Hymenobacter montanus]MBD2769193.1 beta-lactamase family protein [Hymenobacter montanus]
MKTLHLACVATAILCLTACDKDKQVAEPAAVCAPAIDAHPKAAQVQAIIKRYTDVYFPGAVVAFKDANGYWQGATGYSQLETKTPMQACQLAYAHSVTKFYTANVVMLLSQEGKINLDAHLADYLPAEQLRKIPQSDRMTVRMLLNHTSGIQDYTEQTDFQNGALVNINNPAWFASFTPETFLSYIEGKDLLFEPGTDAQYSNCNYILLARIIERITGKSYAQVLQEKLFNPLGLRQTYYPRDLSGYDLPGSYLDVKGLQGQSVPMDFENVTATQKAFTQVTLGEDGIIAAPSDFVRFIESFALGRIVNSRSAEQMLAFPAPTTRDPRGHRFSYGLGVWNYAPQYGVEAYGHPGGLIGYANKLVYIPSTKTSLFASINCNADLSPTLNAKFEEMAGEVVRKLAE